MAPPLKRRVQSLNPIQIPSTTIQREPRKKALLVGITYKKTQSAEGPASETSTESTQSELHGPHEDILAMKQLLIEQFGYSEENIDILTDHDDDSYVEPNRANILAHIRRLVQGAIPGDRFFFHYAGHTTQIENVSGTEEDGLDECLVPSDQRKIVDNELRRCLVDPLPVGSHLVAIFDSCHSGSLLDLPHYRCNRIYVPWASKGKRRTDFLRNAVVRGNAMPVNLNIFPTTTRKVYQAKRTSPASVVGRKTSMFVASTMEDMKGIPFKARSLSIKTHIKKFGQENSPTDLRQCESPIATMSNGFHKYDSPISPFPESFFPEHLPCDSPVPTHPCTGWCSPGHVLEEEGKADVISIGSCKDDQLSWDDESGTSAMTQALVEVLKEEPHPTLKDFMTKVEHSLHKKALIMHERARAYRKEFQTYRSRHHDAERAQVEMDNFQTPELSSHQPLDMERRLSL